MVIGLVALLAAPLLLGHGGELAVLNATGIGIGVLVAARLLASRGRRRVVRR